MSSTPGFADTLGELLASRRQRRFVGRAAELELVRSALTASPPPFSVLHVHGPGGIGKTSLLQRFAALADEAGATVVRLDGRDLAPATRAVVEALRETLDVPDDGGPVDGGPTRLVLLVDHYERLAPVDEWVRTELLPRLPATALTVLAGRDALAPGWRADPAWRDLLRVVTLRNLAPEDGRAYLAACGVAPELHDRLLELTHGHPLGLSLFADVVVHGGDVAGEAFTPDLVRDLLRGFVDVVPEGDQRLVLAVCALARVTTQALLRATLGSDDADAAFTWLRGLSFVETGTQGLVPHELARDALEADLRWRDREEHTRILGRIAEHIRDRLRSPDGSARQQAAWDLKYLFRILSDVRSPVDWDVWGQHDPVPADAGDGPAILDLIAAAEGPESAAIAARWWERQPQGFHVVRDERDRVQGVIVLLDLTAASEQDRAVDPAALAVWAHAHRETPPRPGEVVTQTRFIVDRDRYQGPSSTMNAVPIVTLQHKLATSNLAWDYLTLHEPEPWVEYFALADLHLIEEHVEVGGRRYGAFAHDYRRVPVDDLVRLWIERAITRDPTAPAGASSPPVQVLSQAEFTAAARQALKDLHRADLLARNPLLGTRLLRDRADGEEGEAATLARLLRDAVDTLRTHPRDDKLLRAVETTYLAPAATQEAAAARLGLPFSTYRRHLTLGVERIVSWLWDREVYGTAPPSTPGEQN
jgi:hypothetical protein